MHKYLKLSVLVSTLTVAIACEKQAQITQQKNNASHTASSSETRRLVFSSDYAEAVYQQISEQMSQSQRASSYISRPLLIKMLEQGQPEEVSRLTHDLSNLGVSYSAYQLAKRWVTLEPNNIEALQYKALLALRLNHYDDSADVLRQIQIQAQREGGDIADRKGLVLVSTLLMNDGHYKKNYLAYQSFVRRYVDSIQTRLTLSVLALRAGDFDAAERSATLVYKYSQENFDSQLMEDTAILLSKIYAKRGKHAQAISMFETLNKQLKLKDDTLIVYLLLLNQTGQKEKVERLLRSAHKNNPNSIKLRKSMSLMLIQNRNFDEAERVLKELVGIPLTEDFARTQLANIYKKQGLIIKARKQLERIGDGAYHSEAMHGLAAIIYSSEGFGSANEWVSGQLKSSASQSVRSQFYHIRAHLYISENKVDEALAAVNLALALMPDDTTYLYSRALIHQRQNKLGAAERDYKEILELNDRHDMALNAYGFMLLSEQSRFHEAKPYLEKAHLLKPGDSAIQDSLGWYYFKAKQYDKSYQLLNDAYAAKQDPEIAAHLIHVMRKTAREQEAQSLLSDMLKKFPHDRLLNDL